MLTLTQPVCLEIQTPRGVRIGGSQAWYPRYWQRMSGCGPTSAANQIWYLARSRPRLRPLLHAGSGNDKAAFVRLQLEMFNFITPGMGGVNKSRIFTRGAVAFGKARGVSLAAHALDIPKGARPGPDEMRDFIETGLRGDCPVAFLNLASGDQRQLESWHWVTVIALDGETLEATVSDQGRLLTVDLAQWLRTSRLGGAFVYLEEEFRS